MPELDMIRTREQRARRLVAKAARDRLVANDRIHREIAAMVAGDTHDEAGLAWQYTSAAKTGEHVALPPSPDRDRQPKASEILDRAGI